MLEARQREQQIERAFRSLSREMQMSLNLSFYEPVPNRDAAEMMGLSVKAFQSLLMRAKKALKQRVMEQEATNRRRRYG